MSWSVKKKGEASEVLKALKEDSGAAYMPAAVSLLAEEMLCQVKGPVELSTNGHVFEGIGEVHLSIAAASAEEAQATAAEGQKEEVPA